MTITFPAMQGRDPFQVSVAQGGAGSLDLVAAPGAGKRIFVTHIALGIVAGGTIKFTEGTGPTDLTGAFPFPANGGLIDNGAGNDPVLSTNTENAKLSLVSTGGGAQGWIRGFIADDE